MQQIITIKEQQQLRQNLLMFILPTLCLHHHHQGSSSSSVHDVNLGQGRGSTLGGYQGGLAQ